jgi:integrase
VERAQQKTEEEPMPRKRKTGDGALYPVRGHGCGRVDGEWKCGKRPAECPRAVVVKWKGVVDLGFSPDGTRLQKAVTSKSQSVTRKKLDELMDEIKKTGSPLGNQKVAEWGASWLSTVLVKKPQTYRTYKSILETWVFPAIGRKNVKDVRPSDLQRIYSDMRAAGKASSTLLKAHNTMSSMFEAARLERLTPENVTRAVRPPKALKAARDTFAPDETLKLLEAASRTPDGSKWAVSLYAGIRQGERLGATIDSVDLDRGLFTVQWNLVEGNYAHGCPDPTRCFVTHRAKRPGIKSPGFCPQKRLIIPEGISVIPLLGRYMLVPPKSGESRTFPLLPRMVDMLRDHIESLGDRAQPFGLLWPDLDGNPVEPRADQEEWKQLLKLAEVKRHLATTHWARHTAISDFTAAGVPERVTGEIVGHRSPGITGRYQHVSSKDAADAMGKLGDRRVPEDEKTLSPS